MVRVILSHIGNAYARDCSGEGTFKFMERLEDIVYSGDPVLVVANFDDLKEILNRNYNLIICDNAENS